jgi:hypothetical protein
MFNWFFKVDVKEIQAEVRATIEPLLPKQYDYAMHTRDLRNISPTNLMVDNNGNRVAGIFGVSDALTGAASPVVWAFFMPILLLSILSVITFSIAAVAGGWIPFKAFSHSIAATPTWAWAVWDTLKGIWFINLLGALPSFGMYYYGYVVMAEMDPNRLLHNTYWLVQVPLFAVATILIPGLSPALGALGSLLVPFILFWAKLNAAEVARNQNLRDASSDSRGVTALPDADKLESQRAKQAEDALREGENGEVELLTMGVSKGYMRQDGDPLTPDSGAVIGFSIGVDSGKNIWAFGRPGTGKTSAVAKRVAGFWRGTKGRLKKRQGGALIMDLKSGELVVELHSQGMIDILVDPNNIASMDPTGKGRGINLFGSLDAQRFGIVLRKIADSPDKRDIWSTSASGYAEAARVLIGFAVTKGIEVDGVLVKDGFRCWSRFVTEDSFRDKVLIALQGFSAEIRKRPALLSNFEAWAVAYPSLPDNTKGSVAFTVRSWVQALIGNEKLSHLLDDDGIDLADEVCKGKFVGSTLCENDGDGALMAQAMIKAAVYSRIQERGRKQDWRKTEQRVLLLVDECSKGLDESDEVLASQGRSLGLVICFMTQDINQVIDRLGKEKAFAMLNCFGQLVCFTTSSETYQYIAGGDKGVEAARIGARYRLVKDGMEVDAALLQAGVDQESSSGLENKSAGGFGDYLGSVTSMIGSIRRIMSLDWQSDDKMKNMLRTQNTDRYRTELRPALMASEMSMYLQGTHVALCVFSRAGVLRREVVDCRPGIEEEPDSRNVKFFNEAVGAMAALTHSKPDLLIPNLNPSRAHEVFAITHLPQITQQIELEKKS